MSLQVLEVAKHQPLDLRGWINADLAANSVLNPPATNMRPSS
jgi:hypothetical protein